MEFQVVLQYGELGGTFDSLKNSVVWLEGLAEDYANAIAAKFNKNLGVEYKQYCPMQYIVTAKKGR